MSIWRNTIWAEAAPTSPNEKWGPGTSSLQRRIRILDGSLQGRVQAAYDFLGYGLVNTSGINYIHRVIPMPYPGLPPAVFKLASNLEPEGTVVPDITNRFWVESISRTEPAAAPTGINPAASPFGAGGSNYQNAFLTLECVTLPYQVLTDAQLIANGGVYKGNPDEGVALAKGWQYTRYITRRREAFNRVYQIPYGVMVTNAPATNNNVKINRTGLPWREGGEHRIYTWMRVPLGSAGGTPGVNLGVIESALGMINQYTFDGAAPQTLLLDSLATREYQGSFGEWLMDVTFNMIYLPHNSSGASRKYPKGTATGWNTVVDMANNGAWDYYIATTATINPGPPEKTVSSGQSPFSVADFSTFFRP